MDTSRHNLHLVGHSGLRKRLKLKVDDKNEKKCPSRLYREPSFFKGNFAQITRILYASCKLMSVVRVHIYNSPASSYLVLGWLGCTYVASKKNIFSVYKIPGSSVSREEATKSSPRHPTAGHGH